MEEALRSGVQRRQRRIVHAARHDDTVARRARALERAREERRQLAEVADDDQPQLAVDRGGAGERREQSVHVLPGIELADIQNVPAGHAKSFRDPPAFVGGRRRELGVHGLGDHRHAFRRHAQELDDVAPCRFGDRDDRVGLSREGVLPDVTEARMRQPEVMLRPAQRREIVDRDHRAARAHRREPQLRRVVDARSRDGELRRQQDGIDREHGELRPPQAQRSEIAMRRQRRRIRGREVAKAEQGPLDVVGGDARECREQVACVATDSANTGHRLQMARIEGDAHGP